MAALNLCQFKNGTAARQPAAHSRSGHGRGAGVSGSQSPARYEIRVEGVLDQRWTACFEGLQVTSEGSQTVISGPLPDQPALHGVLIKVRDLGMCLISVRRLDPDQAGQASPP